MAGVLEGRDLDPPYSAKTSLSRPAGNGEVGGRQIRWAVMFFKWQRISQSVSRLKISEREMT